MEKILFLITAVKAKYPEAWVTLSYSCADKIYTLRIGEKILRLRGND